MTKLVDMPEALKGRRTFGFFDDFEWMITVHRWTSTLTDSGTATVANGIGGILPLVASDGSVADNDEAYIGTSNAPFTFAANKPAVCEASVQFTEANTDDANIIFGFASSSAANLLLDDGGGPPASYTGLVLYKVDGGTTWQAESSVGATQTSGAAVYTPAAITAAGGITAGGASYQTLRIEYEPYSSTKAKVNFFVDGVLLASHDYTYTSAAACKLVAGVKNGGANLETLNVDYMAGYMLR